MPLHNNMGDRIAGFDRLMDELRGGRNRAPAVEESAPREMEVTVKVELSDEAQKFIQVAEVAVSELGV